MRKSTLIAASLLLAGSGLSSYAQDVNEYEHYLVGPFNEMNSKAEPEWALKPVEDEPGTFYGYFEIPAGQFQFYISNHGFGALVPGVPSPDEDTNFEASTTNVEVLDDDNTFKGPVAMFGMPHTYWINEDWQGGGVQVMLDMTDTENMWITIQSDYSETIDAFFIRGEFNEYYPDADMEWALLPSDDEDEFGIYTGYFAVPEGQLSFNIMDLDGNVFIPSAVETVVMEFEDGVYAGGIDNAYDEDEMNLFWTDPEWTGGEIAVQLNLNESTITVYAYPEQETADVWFIRGPFNGYDPDDDFFSALFPVEDENGVYQGAINIPEGEFAVNFLAPNGMIYIPAALATEEIEFADGVFESFMDYAYEEGDDLIYWVCTDWVGGYVNVTIDANEGTIKFELPGESGVASMGAAEETVVYNLQGIRVAPEKAQKGIFIVNGKKVVKL